MSHDTGDVQTAGVLRLLTTVKGIVEAHRMAKDLYAPRLAPDYSVFDFIDPDEMRLSKILAWLLSPQGTHGQGSRFLSLLLDELKVEAQADVRDRADVKTEVVIRNGRPDIRVKTSHFELLIENKPWASDQRDQVQRYFDHLDNLGSPGHKMIYLTPDGNAPHESSINKDELDKRKANSQLYLWSYNKDINNWLARCRAECKADRVSIFLDEFSRYIRKTFEGVGDKTMSDHLLQEIVGSADNISNAMQVILLADQIRERLVLDLGRQLREKLKDHDVADFGDPRSRNSHLTIDYSRNSPYSFALEFESAQFTKLMFGVTRKTENSPLHNDEYASLVDRFGQARQTPWWLWYQNASPNDALLPVSGNWLQSPEPWVEIVNGKMASKIADAFASTHAVLSARGVG